MAVTLMVWGEALPAAEATTYQIRSQTSARANQYLRSDTSLVAPRVFSQALSLSAYDLRGNSSGDFNARIRMRYTTDFALAERLRQDPLFDARWNDLSLDVAFLQWRPVEFMQITGGRHWHISPLGVSDIDGVSFSLHAPTGAWRPFVGGAFGRDVQRGLTPFDPGAFDIQGLPPNEAALAADPWHIVLAGKAGIAKDQRHRAEMAVEQYSRPRQDDSKESSLTRRVGATTTISPIDPLTVTATTSYHSAAAGVDRAHLDAAYRIGDGVVASGIDHRRPVFDSNSIFNLFGAQPYRSIYATYRHRLDHLSTTLELRTWTRLYFDSDAQPWSTGDERALGSAFAGHHRLRMTIPVDFSWQLSAQTMSRGSSGQQYLGDARLRIPSPVDGLFLTGRVLGLWARQDHHRRPSGFATTAVVGAEMSLSEIGQFSLTVETRGGTFAPANAAVFALFELDTRR